MNGNDIIICKKGESGDGAVESGKGREIPIDSIKTETNNSPDTVYNFQVEDNHTYYVGNDNVLDYGKQFG